MNEFNYVISGQVCGAINSATYASLKFKFNLI